MMNLEDYDAAVPVRKEDGSIADRWIRARLNRTVAEVIRGWTNTASMTRRRRSTNSSGMSSATGTSN